MLLSEVLTARGFIHQTTAPSVAELFDGAPRTVYHGIDPTADSAHAGNFVNWMFLRHLASAGHRIVFLVGGGTGMIGDPKPDTERAFVSKDEVAARVVKLKAQAEQLLGQEVTFVDNYDWLGSLDLISFLRDVGKHFTVNELLKKDAIATRLQSETGLSYTEFAYPLLQAYDFLTLYRTHRVTVQVGGSDQWGNMVAGVDLVRRVEQAEVYAVTVPLVVDKTTGKKFGKSEGNAVWLDATKTTPYAFYQFWYNTADENVFDYLKLFTDLTLADIDAIKAKHENDPGNRYAQGLLAASVTTLIHGEATKQAVEHVSAVLFGTTPPHELSSEEQALLRQYAPTTRVAAGIRLVEALVLSGLAVSKREARTFIEDGAVAVGGVRVDEVEAVLDKERDGSLVHVRRGEKQVALVVVE